MFSSKKSMPMLPCILERKFIGLRVIYCHREFSCYMGEYEKLKVDKLNLKRV